MTVLTTYYMHWQQVPWSGRVGEIKRILKLEVNDEIELVLELIR